MGPFDIDDILEALRDRRHPSVTSFNRLEGRPRTAEFTRSLRAEVRDPLWFVTRQWQLGEYAASDAGSPVLTRLAGRVAPLTGYRAGQADPVGYDVTDLPLEALVERRPVPATLDRKVAAGRRWLRTLARIGDYEAAFLGRFGIREPDPDAVADAGICAHPDVWQYASAVAGFALDGLALADELRADAAAVVDAVGPTPSDRDAMLKAVPRFLRFVDELFTGPGDGGDGAWDPAALEYRFAVGAGDEDRTVLRAGGYPGGRLDWSDVVIDPTDRLDQLPDPEPQAALRRGALPTAVAFAGMPNPRWWAFEDGRTNFGDVRADTTDLGRLLLVEFGLVFSNDWFSLPLTVPDGSLVTVDGLAVTTVFGERFLIGPAGTGDAEAWQRWGLYQLSGRADGRADQRLLVLPTTPAQVQEGPLLEDVALVRDEMANLVWGIESRVPTENGSSMPGAEAADDTRRHAERLAGVTPSAGTPDAVAPIRYRLASPVPEHWIPFLAVHRPGSDRDVALQRGALPRLLDGSAPPVPIRPRTSLLRPGLDAGEPYFVNEEEVPRSGTRVTLRHQRVRWYDGRVVVWLAARRETGRGEGSSGLRFDQTAPTAGAGP